MKQIAPNHECKAFAPAGLDVPASEVRVVTSQQRGFIALQSFVFQLNGNRNALIA